MSELRKITLQEWDTQYARLKNSGMPESAYGGPLSRHVDEGDLRLLKLKFDNSPEALRLWNFLLTEEDRLQEARREGKKLVGTMKDLGTVPVMAYSLSNVTAFYPDGAWWIPCVMELSAGLLGVADSLGIDESFCPVRAMLGAFLTEAHFPIPDYLVCSVGATCDDFSAIAQRLNGLGYPIEWWEIPHRRSPDSGERSVTLPGEFRAPQSQVNFVKSELERIRKSLEVLAEDTLDEKKLTQGIVKANQIRKCLRELRRMTFTAERCPMPALELLIAEMLAIHFCSDRDEALSVLQGLVFRVKERIKKNTGYFETGAPRIFWVNPVADISVMNTLEECGGRICGTEYLFSHALDAIPTDLPPMEALARMALADPMVGSGRDRAERICSDIDQFGAEALILSKIPGASHCAVEGRQILETVRERCGIPVLEIEVPPLADAIQSTLKMRFNALIEIIKERRNT
jgi:benzoyl-CoA reductase/2-hydroxyglutaryl-CoA dehydratase subunit BcrC/BadD/HgdB